MGKLSVQDLSNVLVEKNGLKKDEAKRFVVAMFDVIRAGVETQKLVKVKGLGTFKVIDVDARESVNVNTGDRVIIDSHSKISFTPDATMKELVNKPFSSFETVVLNDGVEFEDTPTPKTAEKKAVVEEEALITAEEKEDAPVVTEEKETPVVEEEPLAVAAEEQTDTEEEEEEEKPASVWWKWVLALVLGIVIGFASGYYAGKNNFNFCSDATSCEKQQTAADSLVADTLAADTMKVAAAVDSLSADTVAAPVVEKAEPQVSTTLEAEPEYKKYDAMDNRVRLGAYYIDGLDQEVEARAGDNLAKVSRRYLGEGMSCYVEVYNGMTAKTELKEGQKIKIPKLKWRKYLKKDNK
jgi:nucleoid DNA-binding protein